MKKSATVDSCSGQWIRFAQYRMPRVSRRLPGLVRHVEPPAILTDPTEEVQNEPLPGRQHLIRSFVDRRWQFQRVEVTEDKKLHFQSG